jgi:hypothetical protein
MDRTSPPPEAFKTEVVKIPLYVFNVLVVFGKFQSNILIAPHVARSAYGFMQMASAAAIEMDTPATAQARLPCPSFNDVLSGISLRNTAKLSVH